MAKKPKAPEGGSGSLSSALGSIMPAHRDIKIPGESTAQYKTRRQREREMEDDAEREGRRVSVGTGSRQVLPVRYD